MLPSLVTFVLALQRLTQRLSMIANTLNQQADNSGRLTRLNEILSPDGKQFRRQGGVGFVEILAIAAGPAAALDWPRRLISLITVRRFHGGL